MHKHRACYGKLGGNVAYHGYQSFKTGEVTPQEAHTIGMETARRMWGDDYEIVVTTHLNTDNIHNHIVVNSVSFRTGRKFENHVSDHYRLREISDAVCQEYGKSVLDKYIEDYKLLCDCHIDTAEELFAFRENVDAQLEELKQEREHIRNKIRLRGVPLR